MEGKRRIIAVAATAALVLGTGATATLAWAVGEAPEAAAGEARPRTMEAVGAASASLRQIAGDAGRSDAAARGAARNWERTAQRAIAATEAVGEAAISEPPKPAEPTPEPPGGTTAESGGAAADEETNYKDATTTDPEPIGAGNAAATENPSSRAEDDELPQPARRPEEPRDEPAAPETPSQKSDEAGSDTEAPRAPQTLVIDGAAIPYRDVRGGTTPDAGAGLWLGSDSTTDGSWGYFVGHNPGSFAPVRRLAAGSQVAVCDSTGAARTYTVRTVFAVDASATWKTIASRVTGYGESVILQTCTGDGTTNTIVVAA